MKLKSFHLVLLLPLLMPAAGRAAPSPLPAMVADGRGGWIVDLDADMLAAYGHDQVPAELDERLQAMRLRLMLLQEQRGIAAGDIEFRFDGMALESIFSEAVPATLYRDAGTSGVDVFVSASHGWYFHHGAGAWRLQRPLVNGMVEDLVTPAFAGKLVMALQAGGYSTVLSRSTASHAHPIASQPWWQMASRYHAQALHPGRPDIWQSYSDRESPLREYNDDIRTRPLLANERGARALVHLHTNAAGSPAARGAMAFHQTGRPEDKRLGHNLLCAMRDAIRSLPRYRDYAVRVVPHTGNFGENRLANAPSILIELGFHTNAEDAAALQDPQFQQAVAEGLHEGYRGFEAGQGRDGEVICR